MISVGTFRIFNVSRFWSLFTTSRIHGFGLTFLIMPKSAVKRGAGYGQMQSQQRWSSARSVQLRQ